MEKHLLSKSTFIRGMQCQKSLYLHKKRPFLRDRISAEQLAKFKRGTDVGVIARDLYPGGIDMSPKSPSQYQLKVLETAQAMAQQQVQVIYEAVFQSDDVLIMLDILLRDGNQWKAIEVKSSLKLSETYFQDAALQYYVLKKAGVDISDFELMYIDSEYVLQDELQLDQLFKSQSVMEYAASKLDETAQKIALCKETLKEQKSPEIPIGLQCDTPYPCDFKGHCWKNVAPDAILYTDAIAAEQRFAYFHQNTLIDKSIIGSETANRLMAQINALKQNTFWLEAKSLTSLRNKFEKTQAVFLKMLYHQPAIPEAKGAKPYQAQPLAIAVYHFEEGKWHSLSAQLNNNPIDGQKNLGVINDILKRKKEIFIFNDQEFSLLKNYFFPETTTDLQITDLHGVLQSGQFFAANPKGLNPFDLAISVFHPDQKLPKNEVWMRKDFLEEAAEQKQSVLTQLEKYPKLMAALIEKLVKYSLDSDH